MKKVLLASALCLSGFSLPMAALAGGPASEAAKECAAQPLSFACLGHYALRNEENVAKALSDVSAGRLPTLRAPALPVLENLPAIDLEKMMTMK